MTKERKIFELKGIKRNLDAELEYNEVPYILTFRRKTDEKDRYFLRAVEIEADGNAHVRDIGEVSTEYGELLKEFPHIETEIKADNDSASLRTISYIEFSSVESSTVKIDEIENQAELAMFSIVSEEMVGLQARINYLNLTRQPDGPYNSIFTDDKTCFKEFLEDCIEKDQGVSLG